MMKLRLSPLVILLLVFFIIGTTYALVTPLFEASDELWHYPVVWHISQTNELPVLNPINPGPWRQEAGQPPLYYYIMYLFTDWIDTSDMHSLRILNPHVDNGIVALDGNINMVIPPSQHHIVVWSGTALAIKIIRILSVLMSTATVYVTYLLSLTLFPNNKTLALSAASLLAFTPMFAFISGSVNNDNLTILIASITVLTVSKLSKLEETQAKFKFKIKQKTYSVTGYISLVHILLGFLLGLGALTKLSLLTLFPVVTLAISFNRYIDFKNDSNYPKLKTAALYLLVALIQALLICGIAFLVCSWWYFRNLQLYNSLTGINVFIDVLGKRSHPASILQLWSERFGFFQSYWGLFGGVNVALPSWIYTSLNTVSIFAFLGLIVFATNILKRKDYSLQKLFPIILNLIFVVAIIISLIRWATDTWSSQGRLVFTALPSIKVFFILGVFSLFPKKLNVLKLYITNVIIILLFITTALTPYIIIRPKYSVNINPDTKNIGSKLDINLNDKLNNPQMRLLGYTLPLSSLKPGDSLPLDLYWQSITEMYNNWSVFIHLIDSNGTIVAQRDTYPGVGLIATSTLNPGTILADQYIITIPPTATTPTQLSLTVGLYDYKTGSRLYQNNDKDNIFIDTIDITPHSGPYPNNLSMNFQNIIELVGYNTDSTLIESGQDIHLTLYWFCNNTNSTNYTVFTQIIGENNQKWGQHDSWPNNGNNPTSACNYGDVIQDIHQINIKTETPPGTYALHIGLYDESGIRLQRINSNGRWIENYLSLTKIKVIKSQ